MKRITNILIIALIFLFSEFGGSQIGDRVLIEIEDSFYTQRQMESYIFIKATLGSSGKSRTSIVSSRNWSDQLDAYLFDMQIHQDTQRMGSFFPNDKTVSDALKALDRIKVANLTFSNRLYFLGIDGKYLKRIVAQVLQINGYRRSKSVDSKKGKKKGFRGNWIRDLKKKFVIRHFDGSDTYLKLTSIN